MAKESPHLVDHDRYMVTLPSAAQPAWRAYCAMLASKDAHFSALENISRKRAAGEQPTLSEVAYLAQLLAAHDSCVGKFSQATRALALSDRDAQAALVSAITDLNHDVGDNANSN